MIHTSDNGYPTWYSQGLSEISSRLSFAARLFPEAQLLRKPRGEISRPLRRQLTEQLMTESLGLSTHERLRGLREYTSTLPPAPEQIGIANNGTDVTGVLGEVTKWLGYNYRVMGGAALVLRGIPVPTRDVDIIVPDLDENGKYRSALKRMAEKNGASIFTDDDPSVGYHRIPKFCCTLPDGTIFEAYDGNALRKAYFPIRSTFIEQSGVDVGGGLMVGVLEARAAMQATIFVGRPKDMLAAYFLQIATRVAEGRGNQRMHVLERDIAFGDKTRPLHGTWRSLDGN